MSEKRVVAALPADGWRVRNRNEGMEWDEPIVGWVVMSDSSTYAVVHDQDGDSITVDGCAADLNLDIYHPDRKSLSNPWDAVTKP